MKLVTAMPIFSSDGRQRLVLYRSDGPERELFRVLEVIDRSDE